MKYSDLKAGMKIRAVGDWSDCWKVGDEFEVAEAGGWWYRLLCFLGLRRRDYFIGCHDHENGGHHGLDGTATDDGDLPEFEPA